MEVKQIQHALLGVTVFVWIWVFWLGYDCYKMENSLKHSSLKNTKIQTVTNAKQNNNNESIIGHRYHSETIQDLEVKALSAENEARKALEEWQQRQSSSIYIQQWNNESLPEYVALEEIKDLFPDKYEELLSYIQKTKDKLKMHIMERQEFVKSIKEEWLTKEEYHQLLDHFQILNTLDEDIISNGGMSKEERQNLKKQEVPLEQIQKILKKCCYMMVGDNGDTKHFEEKVEEIRTVCKVPEYDFILPSRPKIYQGTR